MMTNQKMTAKEINEQTTSFFYNNEFKNKEGQVTRRITAINDKFVWVEIEKWGMRRQERSTDMTEVFEVM